MKKQHQKLEKFEETSRVYITTSKGKERKLNDSEKTQNTIGKSSISDRKNFNEDKKKETIKEEDNQKMKINKIGMGRVVV